MKMKVTDVLDDKNKTIKWWNRNWFFAATVVIIVVNLLIYFFANNWQNTAFPVNQDEFHWYDVLYFTPTIHSFFNSFSHANVQHVCLNMLCFFVAGIYLERKYGSVSVLLTVIIAAYISSLAITANDLSVNWCGFSGVNYFLYAYVIVDYIFYFIKNEKRNKVTTIFGGIVIALIYLASCFNGGTEKFSFSWYPYDLSHNTGHYTSFLIGLICTLALKLVQLKTRWEERGNV